MFKLMSLNLNGYGEKHGAWSVRRGMIQNAITVAQPDVLAFQAVTRDERVAAGVDQAMQLAEQPVREGFRPPTADPEPAYPHVYFQPAAAAVDGVEMGAAIVSRLPFAERDSLRLSLRPGLEDTTSRVLLMARFDLPAAPLTVFNAHFSWVKEQLQDNLDEALPWITQVQAPAILVGDFNAPAGEGLLYLLREAGWVDAWEALRGDQPGNTFEAGRPSIRIDYAWANPFLVDRLRSVDIVAGQPGPSGEHVSDHYGLLVGLDV